MYSSQKAQMCQDRMQLNMLSHQVSVLERYQHIYQNISGKVQLRSSRPEVFDKLL